MVRHLRPRGRRSRARRRCTCSPSARRWPTRAQWRRLALVAGGAVVGFPLLTGLALVTSEAQHGAVFVALLPAATALAAVARAGERPGAPFWLAAVAGLLIVVAFTVADAGRRGHRRGPVPPRRDRRVRGRLRRGRGAQPRPRRRADDLLGARPLRAGRRPRRPRSRCAATEPRRGPGRVARPRLRLARLDVPRLLRLVRRPRARRRREGRPDAAAAAAADASSGPRSCSASTSAPGRSSRRRASSPPSW